MLTAPSALAQVPTPSPTPDRHLSTPQATARPPPARPAASAPQPPAQQDPFGDAVTLTPKTIIFVKGNSTWDKALGDLQRRVQIVNGFSTGRAQPAGPSMTIYTQADDTGFPYQAAVPVAEAPKDPPKGIALANRPAGKALKFMHRGSYDSMDNTYEAITNHLDEKRLEAQDLFVEEYETDLVTTPEDKLVVTVYVPIK